jgi:hypothetical protein
MFGKCNGFFQQSDGFCMHVFSSTVTNSVAVFLVRTRFQNGFLCDFIVLLNYYKVVFLDFCLEYKHNNRMTFSRDLELKNSFCLAIIILEIG